MSNARVNVFGRIKPCKDKNQSQIFELNFGKNGDSISFSSPKLYVGKKSFKFQKIFPEHTTQEEIFNEVARPIIKKVLTGYNGTIFTYGQTGSGKTYTMTGDVEAQTDPGLIQRTIQELFYLKSEDTIASMGYYEIYNEQIFDLIKVEESTPQLVGSLSDEDCSQFYSQKHNGNRVTSFRNLTYPVVKSAEEATQIFLRGDANRMVAETAINSRSSRSHVIFSVTLDIPHPSEEKLRLKPILYLIDLAGSEKMPKGPDNFNHLSETRFINLSLYYLEQVLMALRQPKRLHIPYRNSLMTSHLKNSLGGNCLTSMIATISVVEDDIEEAMHTCRFAERLSQIKNDVRLNEITENQKEIAELKRENERLRAQIKMISQKEQTEQLTEKEKEKCVEMVQNYIQFNDSYYLPLSDTRLMRHCFSVMRKELLDRSSTCSSENFSGLVCVPTIGSRSKTEDNITTTKEPKTTDFVQKRRSVYMSLPKVNITYETFDFNSKQTISDALMEKKITVKANLYGSKKSKTSIDYMKVKKSSENILRGKGIVLKESKSTRVERKFFKDLSPSSSKTSYCSVYSRINTSETEPNTSQKGINPGSQPASKPQQKVYRNTALIQDHESNLQLTLQDPAPDQPVTQDPDQSEAQEPGQAKAEEDPAGYTEQIYKPLEVSFSTDNLPLTGDDEVDEEIVKFYKARYEYFNKTDF